MILLTFLVSFIWAWIAVKEVRAISKGSAGAALWAGMNTALAFVFTYVVAVTLDFYLIIPYVLGDMLATFLALRTSASARPH